MLGSPIRHVIIVVLFHEAVKLVTYAHRKRLLLARKLSPDTNEWYEQKTLQLWLSVHASPRISTIQSWYRVSYTANHQPFMVRTLEDILQGSWYAGMATVSVTLLCTYGPHTDNLSYFSDYVHCVIMYCCKGWKVTLSPKCKYCHDSGPNAVMHC